MLAALPGEKTATEKASGKQLLVKLVATDGAKLIVKRMPGTHHIYMK